MPMSWIANKNNTEYTASGRRGKYTIRFIGFSFAGEQIWELLCDNREDSWCTSAVWRARNVARAWDDA